MNNIKIGLQIHSVREAFKENPLKTLEKVKDMGYEGVEFPMGSITSSGEGLTKESAAFYREALKATGLECFGILTSWESVQPDKIQETIKYNQDLESPFLVIGSVAKELVSNPEDVKRTIEYMNVLQRTINSAGLITGYHNHDTDFFNVNEGKTFFEHVFDNTQEDFVMLLDTGNALAGGFDSINLIKKYPNRSPFLHIKGFSREKGYLAYIGEDDFHWPSVIRCAYDIGKAKTFSIEFGARGDYDPFERAKTSYDRISKIVQNYNLGGKK